MPRRCTTSPGLGHRERTTMPTGVYPREPKGDCVVEGCGLPAYKRHHCNTHYIRLRRYGDVTRGRLPRPPRYCTVEGCNEPYEARGYCNMHYLRLRHRGDVSDVVIDVDALFWSRVNKHGPVNAYRPELGPCWLWTGYQFKGRGRFQVGGLMLAYHYPVGRPPRGRDWDHLCCVPLCVRPEHLELVTRSENVKREAAYTQWKRQHQPAPELASPLVLDGC